MPPLRPRKARCPLLAIAGLVWLGVLALPQEAEAQLLGEFFPEGAPSYDSGPGVTVLSRLRPEYEPPGVRIGDFIVRPGLVESLGYNNNVLGGTPAHGSALALTDGTVMATSNWARDSLVGYLDVQNREYFELPQQSETNLTVSLGGTIDVGRDAITLGATHLNQHQDPTSIDNPGLSQPLPYTVNDFRAGYTSNFARMSLTPQVDFATFRFGMISGPSQAYRDRNSVQESLTARYEFAPLRNAVFVVRSAQTDYLQTSPGTPTRNSIDFALLAGLDYEVSGALRYRALVGYEKRNFESSAYKSTGAPLIEGDLIWTPTNLTTITGTALRAIAESAEVSSPAYTYTQLSVRVDHEYLRNVLLQGNAGLQNAAYTQGGGQTKNYSFGAGVTWLLNRNIQIGATYQFAQSQSNLNQNYKLDVILLQVRFSL